jgi:hypothetical protein
MMIASNASALAATFIARWSYGRNSDARRGPSLSAFQLRRQLGEVLNLNQVDELAVSVKSEELGAIDVNFLVRRVQHSLRRLQIPVVRPGNDETNCRPVAVDQCDLVINLYVRERADEARDLFDEGVATVQLDAIPIDMNVVADESAILGEVMLTEGNVERMRVPANQRLIGNVL